MEKEIENLVNSFYKKNVKAFPKQPRNMKIENIIKKYSLIYEIKKINELDIKTIDTKCKFNFKEFIAKGWSGSVYKLDSKNIVKIVPLLKQRYTPGGIVSRKITNEIKITEIAGLIGVGAKLNKYTACCDKTGNCYYALYMEYINGITLNNYILSKHNTDVNNKLVKKMLKEKLKLLHKNNIIHGDLSNENIIVNIKDSKIVDLRIIDYGKSVIGKDIFKNELLDIKKLFQENDNLYNYVVYNISKKLHNI